ncbi:amidohydrolase [Mesorhizobium amorphae]|nr:amidohydrolase [Mesorhizobium amorphae]
MEVGERGRLPSDAAIISAAGKVVMPGLCDAHVHVTAFTADFALLGRTAPTFVAAKASEILHDMLMRGFTTVRDAGGADHGIARAVREGLFTGPDLLFCGKAISQSGGHGDMRLAGEYQHGGYDCCAGLGRVCDGVPEIRKGCRDAVRQGAHHIKLMVSGGVSSPTDRISSTQLSEDELKAAVEEAEAAEIYCMAHAYTPRAIERAVADGVRSIEHGNLLDREAAAKIKKHGAFLVPTLVTYDSLAREGAACGLSSAMQRKIKDVLDAGRQAFELAVQDGLKIAFGTDLLGPMHKDQMIEFAIRGESQGAADVIRSATLNFAELVGREGQIGTIAPGADADILIVDGNPLDSLEILQRPAQNLFLIMKKGKLIKSLI